MLASNCVSQCKQLLQSISEGYPNTIWALLPFKGIKSRKFQKIVTTLYEIGFYLRNWAEREPGYLHKCLKFLLNLLYNLLFIFYCSKYGTSCIKPSVRSNKIVPLPQ